jgi:hypothetical protein
MTVELLSTLLICHTTHETSLLKWHFVAALPSPGAAVVAFRLHLFVDSHCCITAWSWAILAEDDSCNAAVPPSAHLMHFLHASLPACLFSTQGPN